MNPRTPRRKTAASMTDLGSAIGEIRQACEELGSEAHRSPFFLIVGAGISYPPVPLAANIIEHCQQVAGRYKREGATKDGAVLDLYSEWFGRAYPSARQRQQYLRSLIERKPLSLASLRLAHLLSARSVTNVVITTNFDDFIPRALRLFGEEPAVCDHPRTIGRIDRDLRDVQVVHAHGSYLFYDLANLRGEVTARARTEKETSLTMMGLLDNLLWARSPLVVGYSGWEGDIIMSALRRRLRGGHPLAQSIYWFCYRRSEIERLPTWLRFSADVRFVVPPEAPEQQRATTGEERAGPTGERPPEPAMPAYEVFDQLNESFAVGKPEIFVNPVRYFAQTLQAALPDIDGTVGDPYSFKALIERLNKAAESFETTTRPQGIEAELDKLRGLMREANYSQAIKLLGKIMPARLSKLDGAARTEVVGAARLAGTALLSKRQGKPIGEDLARVAVFDPAIERIVGDLPQGTVWCLGSRSDQFGMETTIGGKMQGAFTSQFTQALRRPAADIDDDGRISLLECTVEVAGQLTKSTTTQIPVVVGDAEHMALFASKRNVKREHGTLHAVVVAVSNYKEPSWHLGGPVNDAVGVSSMLRSPERRLFRKVSVHELRDGKATRAAVVRALEAAADESTAEDLVMLYFSGHGFKTLAATAGATADALTLMLHDSAADGSTGSLTNREISELLSRAKARHKLVVLDF